jgi:ubiquinone/menaquinone biosynthesis C-methylase UbiE
MTNRFLTPKEIVAQFPLDQGATVADFGSGAGDFALVMAEKVGLSGKVYAFDIQPSSLESLRSRAKLQGYTNIYPILANLELIKGSKLPDDSVDLVMIHNILFQVEDKKNLILEAGRILRPGGALVVVEWDISSPIGPSRETRISQRMVTSMILSYEYELEKEIDAGKYHYGVLYRSLR